MCGPPSPLMLINPNAICRPRNSQIQTANKSFTVHQPYNIISYLKTIQNNFNGCVFAFFLASKNLIIGRWSQCCFCYELRSIDLGFSSVPGCGTLCLRPEYQQHVTTKPIGANRKFMNSLCVFVMCDLYASLFSYFTIFIFECVGFQLFDLLLFTMTHDCSYIYIYIYTCESRAKKHDCIQINEVHRTHLQDMSQKTCEGTHLSHPNLWFWKTWPLWDG